MDEESADDTAKERESESWESVDLARRARMMEPGLLADSHIEGLNSPVIDDHGLI